MLLCAAMLFSCTAKEKPPVDTPVVTVKVNEVTHSVFYAPQYAAMALGYFEEEGLEIELTNGGGADKTMAAVLSGDADIGLCGSEGTIYIYLAGNADYPKTFAQLTKCDGSFLLSREKQEDFKIENLKGAHIIAGRKGGMPVMVMEWILRQNGLTPGVDVTVDTSIAFNAMSGAFIGGTGDYVSLFEPTATSVVNEGYGYMVMSLGEQSGNIPYTAYNARQSYIKENPETIAAFVKAIEKGQSFVAQNEPKKIAEVILPYFPDTSLNDLAAAVKNYKQAGAYAENVTFTKESFDLLQDIIITAGELEQKVEYEKLVCTDFFR